MFPPVLSKGDFVRGYAAGEFGNHSPTWDTIEAYYASGYRGLVHIRNRIAAGLTWYNVQPWEMVVRWWNEAMCLYDPSQLYISAMAPTEQTLFQGEVMYGLWGLSLTYTTVAKPMRDALLEDTKTAQGIIASLLLQHYLCPNSYEWLVTLLDRYPDHVVEFSTYSVEWGTLSGFNTVFWEVRKY